MKKGEIGEKGQRESDWKKKKGKSENRRKIKNRGIGRKGKGQKRQKRRKEISFTESRLRACGGEALGAEPTRAQLWGR